MEARDRIDVSSTSTVTEDETVAAAHRPSGLPVLLGQVEVAVDQVPAPGRRQR